MKLGTVAIVGRPNVGKSSLFNRILGKRVAVVADREGVTRDAHFQEVQWKHAQFQLVDTGGFLTDLRDSIDELVRDRIFHTLQEAHVIVFVVDGKSGLVELDINLAKMVRRAKKPIVLAINKAESKSVQMDIHDYWQLGMGEPMPIAAINGEGVQGLLEKVVSALPNRKKSEAGEKGSKGLRLAILGRPNSGKSTLVNWIVGEERVIVSPIAGTTRDSIDTAITYNDQPITLTDTAGLRKKAKVHNDVEYFSNLRSIEAIRRSDVCVLLLDATEGMGVQDLKIFNLIQEAGKGLIIGLNKWDLVEKETNTLAEYSKLIEEKVPDLAYYPKISLSAHTGKRAHKVLEQALRIHQRMLGVLGRDKVIDFFKEAMAKHPHPHCSKGAVKLTRCCQVMVQPPALAFEVRRAELVFPSYVRYLKRRAYEYFKLEGVPLNLFFRKSLDLRTDEELLGFAGFKGSEQTEEELRGVGALEVDEYERETSSDFAKENQSYTGENKDSSHT